MGFFADFERVNARWNHLLPYFKCIYAFQSLIMEPCHIYDEALCNNSRQQFPAITYFLL